MQENQPLTEKFSYDEVAYPGSIFPQMHPEHLAMAAKFCRMNPAPVEKCRVLELGCASGTNLNWLACNLPESEFVGVDLAATHINEAEKNKKDLGLRNVSFFEMNVLEMTEQTFGKFDYIIAHGLFSWVPDFVRPKILSLYDELLTPNGVGFLSYNVYPGSYRRQIVRDIMLFHAQRVEKPLEKVSQGVRLVDFLSGHTATLYQETLKHELESLGERTLENIYHDELSENNQPFYFTEFVTEAEKHNLQFLSESEYFPHHPNNVPDGAAQAFDRISQNMIEYEQYCDFLKCRKFRQTLLCKKDVILNTEINPLKIKEFYISSHLKPVSPNIDLNPDSFTQFINDKNAKIDISHNLTKVVLIYLVNLGWHLITFEELIEKATEILQSQGFVYEDLEKEIEITASVLLQLYSPYSIGFHTSKPNVLEYVSEKPLVSKFARWQANQGKFINNFYGKGLNVENGFLRLLVNLLDGTRTREDLIAELTEIVRSNEEIEDKETLLNQLPEIIDRDLFVLVKMGFLIG